MLKPAIYNTQTPNSNIQLTQSNTTLENIPKVIDYKSLKGQVNSVNNTGTPAPILQRISTFIRGIFSPFLSCITRITGASSQSARQAKAEDYTIHSQNSLIGTDLTLAKQTPPPLPPKKNANLTTQNIVVSDDSIIKLAFENLKKQTENLITENKVGYSTHKEWRNLNKLSYKDLVGISSIKGQRYPDILTADSTMVSIKDKTGEDTRLHANTVSVDGKTLALRCNYPLSEAEHLENHFRMLAQKQVPLCVVIATPDDMLNKRLPNYFGQSQTHGDCNIVVKRPLDSNSANSKTANLVKYGSLDVERYRIKFDYPSDSNEKVVHKTRFMHVTNWPDRTAVDANSIVDLAKSVRQTHIETLQERLASKSVEPKTQKKIKISAEMLRDNPLVIHCSAGVGRTGLLMGTIAALSLVQQNEKRSAQEIATQIVQDMRLSASPTMVQTPEQFDALVKAVQLIINEGTTY